MNPDTPVSKMAVINSIVLLDYKLISRAEKATHSILSKNIFQKPVILTDEQAKIQLSLAREHAKFLKALKETNALSENVSKLLHQLNRVALDFHPRRPLTEFYAAGKALPLRQGGPGLSASIRQKIAAMTAPQQ